MMVEVPALAEANCRGRRRANPRPRCGDRVWRRRARRSVQRQGKPNSRLADQGSTSTVRARRGRRQLLKQAIARLGLSARAYHRVLKVARSIADIWMARIGMLFGIAPAIAPVVGGAIFSLLGWRGIFGFLACYAAAVWVLCWYHLPETLPAEKRQSLHPVSLWRGYRGILGSGEFLRLCFAQSLIFNGVFIYILGASAFVIGHLGLTPQSFAWLFVPVVLGMVAGNYVSSRFAGQLTQRRSIFIGFLIMAMAATWNVAYNLHGLPSVPWAILPLALYNLGMFLAMVSLQMLALDLFPDRRGMASSCQGTVQNGVTTLVAGLVVPLLWDTTLHMALGMASFMLAGFLLFLFARAGRE
jgi:DHA1 family bicyclomycin/chloramphenicol resistance-like MFS transporter